MEKTTKLNDLSTSDTDKHSKSDETENDSKSSTSKTHKKFKLSSALLEQLKDFPEVLEYITSLQKFLEKQKRKIRRLKAKYKVNKLSEVMHTRKTLFLQEKRDVSTQTADDSVSVNSVVSSAPKTLAEEITEAAEIATQQSGFVFEQTSGMYYDYNSGYYYNAVSTMPASCVCTKKEEFFLGIRIVLRRQLGNVHEIQPRHPNVRFSLASGSGTERSATKPES